MDGDPSDRIPARSDDIFIGGPEKGDVVLADYDVAWPERFEVERAKIASALGDGAIEIQHVGSTAVPGLAAKPIIDICLTIADSADEATYVPALEDAGYEVRVREPDWHEHRMLRTRARDVHIHVFSAGSSEIDRMLAFRDRLRSDPQDRSRYESTKRELAQQDLPTMQDYADAKTDVVADIMSRATAVP